MILGISPGTRTFGFVILRDGEIKTCGVKSYKARWSDGKLIHILYSLSQLVHRHKIRQVAVKIPDAFPKSSGYAQLIGAMNVLFENRGIKASYYTLSDLTKRHVPKGKIKKDTLVAYIVHRYPELLPLYRKEQTAAKPYYEKVFEAALVADGCKPNTKSALR